MYPNSGTINSNPTIKRMPENLTTDSHMDTVIMLQLFIVNREPQHRSLNAISDPDSRDSQKLQIYGNHEEAPRGNHEGLRD